MPFWSRRKKQEAESRLLAIVQCERELGESAVKHMGKVVEKWLRGESPVLFLSEGIHLTVIDLDVSKVIFQYPPSPVTLEVDSAVPGRSLRGMISSLDNSCFSVLLDRQGEQHHCIRGES